ncbi:tetratricopeptide repeat domain-containing protein [Penicillium brasilianum]|uniref:Tetratricopeptide repeat domain-containing protein n=1 Tax=Penicillium brasilianum TaxID=104259 RepID=A0A1S9RG73_PENBI|nr:tetratricopeptide repeat domain-containing protein [Penicillium brasilianum]
MDPFSITVGVVGLLDVTYRIGSYLKQIKSASTKIQDEIDTLTNEIEALNIVNDSVQGMWNIKCEATGFYISDETTSMVDSLWSNMGLVLQKTKNTIVQLEGLLKEVLGKKGALTPNRLESFMALIRKEDRYSDYTQVRQRLTNYQAGMQMLLLALNTYYTRKGHSDNDVALGNLSEQLHRQNMSLRRQVARLRQSLQGASDSDDLVDSLRSADAVASSIRFNKHFDVPQNISSCYTGRLKELDELKAILKVHQSRERQDHQKRFVIYGLGGSGKTQFCCKFAQDNREHFWGVFWIDASSEETVKHSYARIAKVGGVEPNENAAKNWLSTLQQPWLLLVDNADDPEVDVIRYLPKGEGGVVLITSRYFGNRRHGTEGSRFFHFTKLGIEEASDLILAVADMPRPWEAAIRKYADQIAEYLGYLPLALVHAGKAILDRLCTLNDYCDWYDRSWKKIRHTRSRSRSGSWDREKENASNMIVYSSYEIIYVGLEKKQDQQSRDALDLLRVFSFFHWENIELDLIKAAAMNPRREREAIRLNARTENAKIFYQRPKTWKKAFQEWVIAIIEPLTKPSPILPAVLTDKDEDEEAFDEDRLRSALSLLVRLGMLTLHDENNSYWMHPLVHTWVRLRPETSTAEQAVWCHAAATVLVQSIFLQAPKGYEGQDERFKRAILPHVENVRRFQGEINKHFEDNQKNLRRLWPLMWLTPRPGFGRAQAVQYVKFSLVYLQCGEWIKAEELQLQVKDYVYSTLGTDSEAGVAIALLLSKVYALQTHNNKARELQYQVLQSAKNYFGPDHPRTLEVMDTLGSTCQVGSRLREAQGLHEEVIQKLSTLKGYGPDHEATLTAISNLSKVKLRHFDHQEAFELQLQAFEGMQKVLGPTHPKTLEAKDDLVAIYGFIGEEHLSLALQMGEENMQIRIKTLGREHPFTLKSQLNVAKIQTAMNQFDEAEQHFLEGLPVARRNLGVNHLGTLTAETWFGHLRWRQGRYSEAQAIWEGVTAKHRYEETKRGDGQHTDRLQAMWFLVHCFEDQGKIDDALEMCEQVTLLVQEFGGEGLGQKHKFWQYLKEKRAELRNTKQNQTHDVDGSEAHLSTNSTRNASSAIAPKKLVKGFTF